VTTRDRTTTPRVYRLSGESPAPTLDVGRLARAIWYHREHDNAGPQGCDHNCAPNIAREYDTLAAGSEDLAAGDHHLHPVSA